MNHTFVIPVYKESPYLEECIQHLAGQTVASNIIITTSTPTPFTRHIAEKYGLDYHVNPGEEKGIARDWNFALSKTNTPLVTIAHQDDIYEAGYTEAITQQFANSDANDILIAFTGYRDIVNGKIRLYSLNALIKQALLLPFVFSRKIGNRALKKILLLFGDPVCCPSVTFNKAVLNNFSFSADYQCALDWYAWYQLSERRGAFLYINKKLVRHRIHSESETAIQLNNGRRKQEETRLFELMWGKTIARIIARIYAIGHKENL